MKNIKSTISVLALSCTLLMSSCKKKMDSLFQNPDAFTTVQIEYVLPAAIQNTVWVAYGDVYNYTINKMGPMMQILANTNDPVSGQWYKVTSDLGFWAKYYTTKMNNLVGMEQLYAGLSPDVQKGYAVYMPITKILEAYATAQATDLFDDMPYTEAFQGINPIFGGTGNYTPKYDAQSVIYYSILDNLKKAAADLSATTLQPSLYDAHRVLPAQDILFQGNLSKWIKLANSLRLRYAMRISDADAARSKSEIADLISSSAPLITLNTDNATLAVGPTINSTGGSGTTYIRAFYELGTSTFAPKMMVDSMKSAVDPRLLVMFTCQGATPSTYANYQGMPVHLMQGLVL
ncbi:MAG: SusD/RagB family nutrient-binding outer membrane lipoprotein [Ferruginibacter sp.]